MHPLTELAWPAFEAERAFLKAVRARRRATLLRRVMRRCTGCARLAVLEPAGTGRAVVHGVRDIPLDAIAGSLDPARAGDFDSEFRPAPKLRRRWLGVLEAEMRGEALPPISVTPVGDAYAIRDGHHRVSVARARGAVTIRALVA